ncbi:DUF4097 family beta strand repeat-containing protein [Peloplasma aerotolerans]|uniref:DUF4097 family beta strand repeat-containing protein n=1 Tax=Peloplasma aerotolerans TaxID=3044389 RepID=A0AAW6U8H4_9MOLU|nr:DUF4097 family beta strand repeat-containing protein [Mariniplasma sp. M4Ah]MDI6452772.1 DUF4097 family beta strand repeat-containing protein [Mariniplasma sp. M4Ah]MDR4968436.1 DUF4097 family beta strand repeat-containing protein [Acholeplasmataceae bacterium]
MKKYLEDLKQELMKRNMSSDEIDEILRDHEEMIESALAKGIDEEALKTQFGDPKKLADDLVGTENTEETIKTEVKDYEVYKSFDPSGESISVFVKLVSEDVVYQPSSNEKINVLYKGTKNLDDYEIKYENSELIIEAPKQVGFFFMRTSSSDASLIVEVPKTLDFIQLRHKSVSSDVKVKDLNVKSFELSSTSGDIEVEGAKFGQTKWNTVSGDIQVKNAVIDILNSSQVSGDLALHQVKFTGDIKLNTVSGDVDAEDTTCETCDYSSVSGDLKGREFYPKAVMLKSVSGDIKISNKEVTDIKVIRKSSVSGKISIKD